MSENDQIKQFSDELDAMVNRFRSEYDLTYASIVGVLQMKSFLLCEEASERADEV